MIRRDEVRVKIGAEDRIEELLSLPKSDRWCNGGPAMHLQSIANPTDQRASRYGCKCWACQICSCWLKRKAGLHFGVCVLQSVGWLYSETSDPKNWARDKKRLQRKGAEWVRVGSMKKPGFLLVCEPADERHRVYCDTERAVKDLGDALRVLTADGKNFRPIARSPGWAPPKKPRKYESLGWIKASDPDATIERLVFVGVARETIRTRRGNGLRSWDVFFSCDPAKREDVSLVLKM